MAHFFNYLPYYLSLKTPVMKQTAIASRIGSFFALLVLLCLQFTLFGQDSTSRSTKTTTTTTTTIWYTQPWVWVVGGIVLLIIVIALTRSSSSSHTTERTTVVKE